MMPKNTLLLTIFVWSALSLGAPPVKIEIVRTTTLDSKKALAAAASGLAKTNERSVFPNFEANHVTVGFQVACDLQRKSNANSDRDIVGFATVRTKDKKIKFEFSNLKQMYRVARAEVPNSEIDSEEELKTITPCIETYVSSVMERIAMAEQADNW